MKISTFLMFFVIFLHVQALAYDDELVHPKINESISKQSIILTKALNDIGIKNGITYLINHKAVYEWLMIGGENEDNAPRWVNHFHDPNKEWSDAGLKGSYLGESAAIWAQKLNQGLTGTWSWPVARELYFEGLTTLDVRVREEKLANAFRAIGQLMHLVSDAASPAHVRNDIHVFPLLDQSDKSFPQVGSWAYETWCKYNANNLPMTLAPVDPTVMTRSIIDGYAPITNLWDTLPPAGDNPNPEGLAEYTNRNFFSEDTVFKDYIYPQGTNLFLDTVVNENGVPEKRIYWKGVTTDGVPIWHLASTGYLWMELVQVGQPNMDDSKYLLDDECYKDYAGILIPKAVGYSSKILDYFFRGQMEVHGEEGADLAGNITSLRIQVANATDGEIMKDGIFVVSYRYKPTGLNEFVYGVSNEINSGIIDPYPDGCSQTYTFNLSNAIPVDATEKQYTLVFKGTLGDENGAVVAKVVELAPFGFYEEWDWSLQNEHPWLTTDIELVGENSGNGVVVNEVLNGKLVKENTRFTGTIDPHINQTYIGDAFQVATDQYCMDEWGTYCVTKDFGAEFPLPITPCTLVRVKIDEMSSIGESSSTDCSQPGSYQGVILQFDNDIRLAFTLPDQVPWIKTFYTYIQPETEISFNIFDAFAAIGYPFVEPVNLESINIVQQQWQLCEPSATDEKQRMVVDYIRLEN